MEQRAERLFWATVALTFVIKLQLAFSIPVTSDEAYFTIWGRFPDFGYYDHPPMAGWFLYLISLLGSHQLLIRLPAILSTILVGIGLYLLLKRHNLLKASLMGTLFLISPINLLNVLITTDTPLIIFAFASIALLTLALRDDACGYYLLSGISLGCAFLSKYFAVLLGLSYLAYFLLAPKNPRRTRGFIILFAALIPFVLLNLYWNYTHCWANIMFNVFNRNKKESFSLVKVLVFLVSQAYLITPVFLYYLARHRGYIAQNFRKIIHEMEFARLTPFLAGFLVPLAILLALSVKKVIGLHWVLAFYPFLYVILFYVLLGEEMLKAIKYMMIFTLVHLVIIGAVLSIPVNWFKNNKNYDMIIMGTHPRAVLMHLEPYFAEFRPATPSYADSALLTYHSKRYFSVFGTGSHHGRQDDLVTDYRQMDGRNIMIVRTSPPGNEYEPFFRTVEIKEFQVFGAKYYAVLGRNFIFSRYRERVLESIRKTFYTIPPWLPYADTCPFLGRYFPR